MEKTKDLEEKVTELDKRMTLAEATIHIVHSSDTNLKEMDKRITHVEAMVSWLRKSQESIETTLIKVTESQQKLHLTIAYAAGGFASIILLGQIAIQGIFAFIQ